MIDSVYHIGDNVRIRTWDDMASEYEQDENGYLLTPYQYLVKSMRPFCGTTQTIAAVRLNPEGYFTYGLCGDKHRWCFTDEMIEGLVKPPVELMTDEEKAEMDIPEFVPDVPANKVLKHRLICKELNDLYAKKNADYGDSFGESFKKYGMTMPLIRLGDKLSRAEKLVLKGDRRVADESLRDTLVDLANYTIMTLVEMGESDA